MCLQFYSTIQCPNHTLSVCFPFFGHFLKEIQTWKNKGSRRCCPLNYFCILLTFKQHWSEKEKYSLFFDTSSVNFCWFIASKTDFEPNKGFGTVWHCLALHIVVRQILHSSTLQPFFSKQQIFGTLWNKSKLSVLWHQNISESKQEGLHNAKEKNHSSEEEERCPQGQDDSHEMG